MDFFILEYKTLNINLACRKDSIIQIDKYSVTCIEKEENIKKQHKKYSF